MRNDLTKIECDFENKIVRATVRDETIEVREYMSLREATDAINFLAVSKHINIQRGDLKTRSQSFVNITGYKPSTFKKIWNKCMQKVWLDPVEKYYSKYCFSNASSFRRGSVQKFKEIQPYKLKAIHDSIDKINQCEKDNLQNLIPFVICFNKNPKELKELFGKSDWKKICKNSHERNRLLTRPYLTQLETDRVKVSLIKRKLEYPSVILRRGKNFRNLMEQEEIDYLHDKVGLTYKQIAEGDGHRYYNILNDTKRMAEQLGKNFSIKWSLDKLEQKHNEYTEELMLKKDALSKEPFKYLNKLPFLEFEKDGITAKVLKSKLEVKIEGKKMHHCVGMYADNCFNRAYSVWSVTDKEGIKYTLGCRVDLTGRMEYSQLYGVCNKVAPKNVEEFANKLILEFNKGIKEEG